MLRHEDMDKLLRLYGDLQEEFARRDGYAIDSEIDKVINGLAITIVCRTVFRAIKWR